MSYAIHLTLWAVIVWQGMRNRLFTQLPLFYCYLAISFVSLSAKMVAPYLTDYWGYGYYTFYFLSNLPVLALSTALLLKIHVLVEGRRPVFSWLVLGIVFSALTYFSVIRASGGGEFTRITSSILFFQLALCTLIAIRLIRKRHAFSLGKNWDAIYLGLAIPNVFHALNSAAFLFENWWPYARYLQPIEPLSWLSWGIVLFGLRRLDLPQALSPPIPTLGVVQENA